MEFVGLAGGLGSGSGGNCSPCCEGGVAVVLRYLVAAPEAKADHEVEGGYDDEGNDEAYDEVDEVVGLRVVEGAFQDADGFHVARSRWNLSGSVHDQARAAVGGAYKPHSCTNNA